MTKTDYDSLPVGTKVWFKPSYLSFAMLGTVKEKDGERGIWVNFFGDGQCMFQPMTESFYGCVTLDELESNRRR